MDNLYKNYIHSLAEENHKINFNNSGTEYANIVLTELVRTAKNTIRILSGNLSDDIMGDVEFLNYLRDFIETPDIQIKIIIEDLKKAENTKAYELIYFLAQVYPGKVKIRESKNNFTFTGFENIGNKNGKIHFSTGGDSKYRLKFDTDLYRSTCSFNDEKLTKKLNELFDLIFESNNYSIPIK